MTAYEQLDTFGAFSAARARFDSLQLVLAQPETAAAHHDVLEDYLLEQGRELQRLLMQAHLDVRAARERRREEVTDTAGVVHHRVEAGHTRTLATVFGKVTVERMAYRAVGESNLSPADAVLNLPAHLHYHGLRRLAATEAVRDSFDAALARPTTALTA
ncbi:hypothetical protein [Streptomyces sp. H27-D2]|uniref:hypothetical protein n=1 Tax=Streptomyces sp. H27-D2 TaxID=3046304 RepID=UPI002DBEFFAA|nr:hypothetical protein [Streptomyces sp. H27-D2]MEC4019294.1 hypothetical protein [Streptomyces sp. H27-D2]